MKLRPYQEEALGAIVKSFGKVRSTLVVMATGGGKTILFAKVAERAIASNHGPVLVLAHREELVNQAADKIRAATGLNPGIEMADRRATGDESVIVSSVQTMASRLGDWPAESFGVLILDEAHHAVSPTWARIIGHFNRALVLGVTATPDRDDKRKLGEVFSNIAHETTILDLVRDGYLSPIVARKLEVEVDLRALKKRGEITPNEAADAMEPHVNEVARQLSLQARDRKLMVFMPDVTTSLRMAEALFANNMDARHISGTSKGRAETLAWFAEPGPKVLCNAMLLTEGFDQPDVDCICILRATKSRSLYSQMVGRGTRLHPGKKELLLLDPLWLTGDHSLCEPADIAVAGKEMRKRVQAGLNEGLTLIQADAQARLSMEQLLENELKRAAKKPTPKGLVNPLLLAIAMGDGDLADWEPTLPWHELPATDEMIQHLKHFNVHVVEGLRAGLADALIERIKTRMHLGLATPKQLQLLRRQGHPSPETATVGQAGVWIQQRMRHFRR